MVCRASAGSSAPAVGARLQVRSGLTGESIARRQLLRCDNAETDPRVNLEACRALGIASIVVLPLLRRNGEVRGLFELFSDHPYAFEERDLVALERMADLTLTALDLAEQRQNSAAAPKRAAGNTGRTSARTSAPSIPRRAAGCARFPSALPLTSSLAPFPSAQSSLRPQSFLPSRRAISSSSVSKRQPVNVGSARSVPEAMLRVQKCASCGFPVSEGRTLCLDCERRIARRRDSRRSSVSGNRARSSNPG